MKGQFIAVCTPTLGKVHMLWANAWNSLATPMNMGLVRCTSIGDPTAEARNKIVKTILDQTADITHIFWLDDDVICDCKAILALKDRRVPVVCGAYFGKHDFNEVMLFSKEGAGCDTFVPDKFYEVWAAHSGLTLIDTNVYRRMRSELDLPEDINGNTEFYKKTEGDLVDGVLKSSTEDVHFYRLVHELGYRVYADTTRAAFGFHIDLQGGNVYPRDQWNTFVDNEEIVWETPDGKVIWS